MDKNNKNYKIDIYKQCDEFIDKIVESMEIDDLEFLKELLNKGMDSYILDSLKKKLK